MGNADLRTLSTIEETSLDELEGATVAVDAYNWLYKYLTTISRFTDDAAYTTHDGDEIPTLIGVPRGCVRFFEHNLTPLFVFDGDPHDRKADELDARREAKSQAATKAAEAREQGNDHEAAKYEARTQRLDDTVVSSTKTLLDQFDIPYVTAPAAAEAQAAQYAKDGYVDYVISDDYDTLLFGAPHTIRNFTSSSKPLELLQLEQTLETHSLELPEIIDVALLCGTDYNDGVHGVGVKTGLSGLKSHDSLTDFLDDRGKTLADTDALQDLFLEPNVTTGEPTVWTPEPDIDGVRSYLSEQGIATTHVETALGKIQDATTQTGLDKWS